MRRVLVLCLLPLASCANRCGSRSEHGASIVEDAPSGAPSERETPCDTPLADAERRYRAFCARTASCPGGGSLDFLGLGIDAGDLDGDGASEVLFGFGVPVNVESHLYKGGPSCVHLLTLPGGGQVGRGAERHEGFADFSLTDHGVCEGSPCGCTPTVSVYRHVRGIYRELKERRVEGRTTPCGDP